MRRRRTIFTEGVDFMKFPRFFLLVLSVAGLLGLCVENAEARIGDRRATRCVPSYSVCYGPAVSLLAKDSLVGWTSPGGGSQRGGWSVVDGILHLQGRGGDIVTERQFENFVLDFEWTIAKGGNSGIKYRYQKFDGKGWLGLEYQVLDDFASREGTNPKVATASLYDVLPTNAQKSLHPHDQVNKGRIVVNGNRIEHYLNGKKVLSTVVGSEEWKAGIASGKFKDIEGFGENRFGHIMVQDHGSEVWFYKITIREIRSQPSVRKPVLRIRCR